MVLFQLACPCRQLNTCACRAAPNPHPRSLDRIDQPSLPLNGQFNPQGLNGSGVHVYILDTGLRTTHEEFAGRVGPGASCVEGPFLDQPACKAGASANVTDSNGHGTHTAGSAVGWCYGVAKAATVHPVKIFDEGGSGSYSTIIAGMRWAMEDARRNGWPAVVSLSLGGPKSPAVDAAVGQLAAGGLVVVVAAGNEFGADACTGSPAGARAAITVASTGRTDDASSYSNVGRCVDIWAPGGNITSAGIASDTATKVLSGTSMATPHVAGVVALMLQANPAQTPAQVAAALASTAVDLPLLPYAGTTKAFLQVNQA